MTGAVRGSLWSAIGVVGAVMGLLGGCGSGETAPTPNEEPDETCGNGTCGFGETCSSCVADCGACAATCGDGLCEAVESCQQCPGDCGACPAECGDGSCNGSESCSSCPGDCGACPFCGDDDCNGNETCSSCKSDCGACPYCGDGDCNGNESCNSCDADCPCPPVCGDAECNGTETWDTCSNDCPLPAAVTWNDPEGKCASSTIVNDGDSNGTDWTWVRSDTHQVMWEDGVDIEVFTDSDVPAGGGAKMYVDGTHVATVACGSGSNGCAFFWRSPSTNKYVDFYISGSSYYWQDTQTFVPCP
jgi:hypothetical protein